MKKEYFSHLLKATEKAYNKSEIKRVNNTWSYSISATRIVLNRPLIIGLNWKAEKNTEYEPQKEMPMSDFMNTNNEDLGSMSRIKRYLKLFFNEQELLDIGQSNFCFFRSEKENQISDVDLKLCEPLFWDFINISKPSIILGFSRRLRDHLKSNKILKILKEKKIENGWGPYNTIKANMKIMNKWIPIYFLPHPSYSMSKELRDEAWKFCFE